MTQQGPTRPAADETVCRTYSHSDFRQPRPLEGRRLAVPVPLCSSAEFADVCPQSIIDTDPSGTGLGVWVLVDSSEPGFCTYEYAGGIV
jgi:hypothetical protein